MSEPTRVEALTLKLLDSDVTDTELEELERLLDEDPDAEALHLALMTQEALLLGERVEVDLADRTVAALKEAQGERVERAVLDRLEPRRAVQEIEPAWRVVGSKWFWGGVSAAAVIALLVVGVRTHRVVTRKAGAQETFVYGRKMLTPGVATAYRVFVRKGDDAAPVPDAAVHAVLRRVGHAGRVWMGRVRTDVNGLAQVLPKVPADAAEGAYVLEVKVRSVQGKSTVRRRVVVRRSFRVLVATDKPLYKPGQKILIRTLSLANADLKPVAGRSVTIEVADAKGNKVLKKRLKTSSFGIASAELRLADQVNLGRYEVSALLGDTRSARTVEVKRYRLPRYRIRLTTKKSYYAPGETLIGEVHAQYTFGKPVARAKVKLVAAEFIHKMKPFANLTGVTNAEGRFAFSVKLKKHFVGKPRLRGDAMAHLTAAVTDATGSTLKKGHDVTVTRQPIRVAVFPESGMLVPGVRNTLYVVTAYPDGRPAQSTVTIPGVTRVGVKTSAAGVATISYTPKVQARRVRGKPLTVQVVDSRGAKAVVSRSLRLDGRNETVLLRTDRALYRVGQRAKLTVLSAGRKGRVFIDVVKDRRTVLLQTVDLRAGQGELVLDLPPDLFGTLELHAYRLRTDGNLVGDTKIIQVTRASGLKITATLDKKTYRPAEKALLKLSVVGAEGKPVQAALSVAGVDEAVFALSELRPGLERVYFMLQEELLKPRYEIHQRLPQQPTQAAKRAVQGGKTSREAGLALFSTTAGGTVPSRNASQPWLLKKKRVDAARRAFLVKQAGRAPWVVLVLFLALLVPLLLYTAWRLVRRTPVAGVMTQDLDALARAGGRLALWWSLGLYLVAGVFGLGALVEPRLYLWPRTTGSFLALLLGVLVVGLCCAKLVVWVRRLRANPAAQAVPLLRKLVTPLPAAYLLSVFVGVALLGVERWYPHGLAMTRQGVLTVVVVMALSCFALVGGLSAALRSVLRKTSPSEWLMTAASRFALVALLPALIGVGLAPGFLKNDPSKTPLHRASILGLNQEVDKIRILGADNGVGDVTLELDGDGERQAAFHSGFALVTPKLGEGRFEQPRDELGKSLKSPARIRRHFPETLVWRPQLITDAQGKASLSIPLADSITSWRLSLSGVDRNGRLGSATQGIRVFQDFFVDLDFPVALTQKDKVQVPASVFNYLDKPQTIELRLQPEDWFKLHGPAVVKLTIGPKQIKRAHFTLTAVKPGRHSVVLKARGSELADAVERKVRVTPYGRKVVHSISGALDKKRSHIFTIPRNAVAGGSDLLVKIHPGTLSQVVEGLDNIFRMPSGCFEQTSSATYPNVLVLDYLKRSRKLKPELELKARRYINVGYQRLLSYEVPGGGFEWFGKTPAHQVLTAYGLMEFADMARVHEVDPKLIARTRRWLFSKQRPDGSWKPSKRGIAEGAINQHRGDVLRTTAYIAWAMLQAAPKGPTDARLTRALGYVVEHLKPDADSYTVAVAANALVAGKHPAATKVLNQLVAQAKRNTKGRYWGSKSSGVTFSRGNVLNIEATALAAYALLKSRYAPALAKGALAWLVASKDARGTWRSTQATILALRALLAGMDAGAALKKTARIRVAVNGKVAQTITVTPDQADVLQLVSLRHLVRPGVTRVTLTADTDALAYQVVATHYVGWNRSPRPVAKPPLSVTVKYSSHRLRLSDPLTCRVAVKYHRPDVANMVIVDLGIPPGFQVFTRSFDDLRRKGVIERYSLTGRQITLYLRSLRQSKPLTFSYQLRARHPVSVRTPRTSVYKYYEPAVRASAPPVKLTVSR